MKTIHPAIKIGTQFIDNSKRQDLCTVSDIWVTYNQTGECVPVEYVTTHDFLGQEMRGFHNEVTILKSLCKQQNVSLVSELES